MRKILLVIISVFIACSSVYAITEIGPDTVGYSYLKRNYIEPSPRSMSMGGVKIVSVKPQEAILYNPAALGEVKDKVRWTPSITLNMYSITDMIQDKTLSKLSKAISSKDSDAAAQAFTKYYMNANTGNDNIAGFDINGGYINRGLGYRLDFSENLTSYIPTSSGSWSNWTLYSDFKLSVGLGKKLSLSEVAYLNLGVSASATYLRFKTANLGNVIDLVDSGSKSIKEFIKNLPVVSGFALPVTVGAEAGYKNFSVGLVARNIMGTHSMKIKDPTESKKYKYTNPMTIDAGLGYNWTKENVKLITEVDLCDLLNCWDSSRLFLNNLHAGAELGYKDKYFVRAGLNSGYWTFGVGVSLKLISIDAAVYSKENGLVAGDRAQKCLSLRISVI